MAKIDPEHALFGQTVKNQTNEHKSRRYNPTVRIKTPIFLWPCTAWLLCPVLVSPQKWQGPNHVRQRSVALGSCFCFYSTNLRSWWLNKKAMDLGRLGARGMLLVPREEEVQELGGSVCPKLEQLSQPCIPKHCCSMSTRFCRSIILSLRVRLGTINGTEHSWTFEGTTLQVTIEWIALAGSPFST